MNKKKILVFPCGSEIGLEIHNALQWSRDIELYGLSSVSSNHGKFVYKNYLELPETIESDTFINNVNAIIDRYQIDYVFPAHDSVVTKLAAHRDKVRAEVLAAPAKTCEICRSKKKTYDNFYSLLRVPKVYDRNSKYVFPVFLKPEVGQGSKGVYKANSENEVDFYLSQDNNLLILEYLPGKEYTVDCFTNYQGELLFVGPRERVRISNGISVDTRPIKDERFQKFAEIINSNLVFRGAWFFQVKEDIHGDLVLQEIAPRIAGTMGLYRNLGINLPLLTVFDAMEIPVQIMKNTYDIEEDRALIARFSPKIEYRHVYIDLDDTILIHNKINPMVMAYLYQCINNDIRIHLLSRHKEDIHKTLKKYKIESLFDSIFHVKEEEQKVHSITETNAIFIDDSYRERLEVSQKLSIPTFDVSSLESLIDWRR